MCLILLINLLKMILELCVFFICFFIFSGFLMEKRSKNFPPGPLGIPVLGYLPFLTPDTHIKIGKLGKKYGNIFSLKMGKYWFVVLNDFDTIKAALRQDCFTGRPNHLLAMSVIKDGIAYNEGPAWIEQRRFALKTLRDFGFGQMSMETSIQEEVTKLTHYLKSMTNTPVDLKNVFAISILNALWYIVAGKKFSLDDPLPRKVYEATKKGFIDPEILGPVYFLPWLATLFPEATGFNKVKKACSTVRELLQNILFEHRKNFIPGQQTNDFVDAYLQEMENQKNNPNSSFYGEKGDINCVDAMLALFIAGSDTLTSTIGFTFLYLTKHQDILCKVHDEIDRVIGKNKTPNISDRQKMPYTEAVIYETYRLSSIVAGSILHSTLEDIEFMGYFIPKGTIIMPNLFQVHHDEKYWKNPEEFKPERFLNTVDGTFKKDERVIPFSIGKRICLAENLAQVELFLFLIGILQKYNIKPSHEYPLPEFTPKSAAILSPTPYKLILTERV